MSIICIVCRDPLTEGQGEGDGEPQGAAAYPAQQQGGVDIVATKCGHLYHFHCLIGWFKKTPRHEGGVVGECPYCKTLINGPNDFLKIFPSGDEDTDLREQLGNIEKKLEEESLNHEIVSYERSEALAEVDRVRSEKEKLEENMNMKETVNSLKYEYLTGQVTSLIEQLAERTILTETLRKKNEELENNLQELTEQIQESKISQAKKIMPELKPGVLPSVRTHAEVMAEEKKLQELLAGFDPRGEPEEGDLVFS